MNLFYMRNDRGQNRLPSIFGAARVARIEHVHEVREQMAHLCQFDFGKNVRKLEIGISLTIFHCWGKRGEFLFTWRVLKDQQKVHMTMFRSADGIPVSSRRTTCAHNLLHK